MNSHRVDHDEQDADQRDEQNIDDGVRQPLDIRANLLKFAERFAAALIFEDRIWQLERVPHAIRVDLRAGPLRDDVDVVILKILGNSRNERCSHGRGQQ